MWDWAGTVLFFFGDGKSVSEVFWVLIPAQMRRCLDASMPREAPPKESERAAVHRGVSR